MYLHRKHTILLFYLLLCSTQVVFGDFMMKAILHGAAMGMMMRPRFLPIPIPMSSNLLSGIGGMFSGAKSQASHFPINNQVSHFPINSQVSHFPINSHPPTMVGAEVAYTGGPFIHEVPPTFISRSTASNMFQKQFDSPQVIVVRQKKPPQPKIIIIQDNDDEW